MRHVSILIALITLVPLVADAKPKKGARKGGAKAKVSVKLHTDKAAKAHKAGKFDVALTELQAAYGIDPQPKLLFAIAQVQAKLDQCPDAIVNYEKFLAVEKNKQKQAVVKQAIAACNEKVASAAPVVPTTPPEPTPEDALASPTPPPPVTPEPVPEPAPLPIDNEPMPSAEDSPLPPPRPLEVTVTKPWYKDVLGDALVLSGVAAGAVSVVMYTGARSSLDDAENAPTLAEYESNLDTARDKRTYSLILAGGSAVLIGAGILRYKLRDKGEARGVAIAPTRGGGFVTWTGGF